MYVTFTDDPENRTRIDLFFCMRPKPTHLNPQLPRGDKTGRPTR